MKLTRSQQISFAVLGLAVSAYLGDRVFNGAAVHPAKGHLLTDGLTSVEPIETAVGTVTALTLDMPLNERLVELGKSRGSRAEMRDAFSTAAWFSVSDRPTAANNARIADFRRLHQLKAIISTGGTGQAVVDETLVRVGEYFDGARLESAKGTQAIFSCNGLQIELRIEEPW